LLCSTSSISTVVQALSSSPSSSSARADAARSKLRAAWSSPSGKLTHAPELVIPEPRDATALLLLTDAVQKLSERVRRCQTNVAFVQCGRSVGGDDSSSSPETVLPTFCQEQAAALGSFPGPVPVVYCSNNSNGLNDHQLSEIAAAGADGVLIQACGGTPLQAVADLTTNDASSNEWIATCQAALEAGLQPVPELTLASETEWTAEDVDALVSTVTERMGGVEPVALVLTVNAIGDGGDDDVLDSDDNNKDEDQLVPLPSVSRELSKRIPILGSVRVRAGDNRLSAESQRLKEAGFSGTFLRSDCVPGFRLQPDLEIVGKFWEACVTDLKSTRSKTFAFRAKNNMKKSVMTQWSNYQKDVIESGALGEPDESVSLMDEAAGDYKGFA